MVDVNELAGQMREVVDLQVAMAQRLADIQNTVRTLEQRAPVQTEDIEGVRSQLNGLRSEAERLGQAMNAVSSLDERVRALESVPRGGATGRSAYDGERATIFSKFNELEAQLQNVRASMTSIAQSGDARVQDTLKRYGEELGNLTATVQALGQQGRGVQELLSKKEVKKQMEKTLNEIADDAKRRTQDEMSVQVRQFQEMYATIQRKLEDALVTFRRQTQEASDSMRATQNADRHKAEEELEQTQLKFNARYEDMQRKVDESLLHLTKEVEIAVSNLNAMAAATKQRTEQELGSTITTMEDKMAQKIRYFEDSFAETQRKLRESSTSLEGRMLAELKRESEKLRTSVLENVIDMRDRMKRVETVEENLEGKVDAKLGEVSKTFAELFDRSSRMLKEEIYEEVTNELAEMRATLESLKTESALQRDRLNKVGEDLQEARLQISDLLSRQRNEEQSLLKDLEALEKRLGV